MPQPNRQRLTLAFGEGLDRERGLMTVSPSTFFDLRNVLLHEGKLIVSPGFSAVGTFDEVDRIVAGVALRGSKLGVVVGYSASTQRVYVYLVSPNGQQSTLLGEWEHDQGGWGSSIPIIRMASVRDRVYMAHDLESITQRAATLVYDPGATPNLDFLVESLDGGPEESESATGDRVRFRGVVRHLGYLFGWGFGYQSENRPEMVRNSLPGEPSQFTRDGYFFCGDRNDPVLACGPAGGVLMVWKRTETYVIFGEGQHNFGHRLVDPRFGIVAGGPWANVGGASVAWSEEGPRVWSGAAPSTGIELPLGLQEWEPTDLVAQGDEIDSWGLYVPDQRVVLFRFGRRVYQLTTRVQGGWRWSVRELGFDAYCGFTLFGGTEPATPSPGYPIYLPEDGSRGEPATDPAGTYADIGIDNVDQEGDETLEIYVREAPVAGGITRDTSGLLARYIQNDATNPFDTADWTASPSSNGVSLQSGRLRFQGGSSSAGRWARHNAVAGRAKQLIFARVRSNGPVETPDSAGSHGIIAHHPGNTDDDMVVERVFSQVEWSGGGAGENSRNSIGTIELDNNGFLNSDTEQFTFVDQHQAKDDYQTARRMMLYVDDDYAEGYEFFRDVSTTIATTRTTGQAGVYSRWSSGVQQIYTELEGWWQMTDKDIVLTGVPTGGSVEILNAADSVLASASETGGSVTFDILALQLSYPGPAKIRVKNSGGTVLATLEPSDGVWGGDVYTYEATIAGGSWYLAGSPNVSPAETQVVRIGTDGTPLSPNTLHDVAARYRRGLTFNAGAENTADPSTWPSVSRGQFTTTADPPTINSATWSRTASDAERITLDITPASGLEADDIQVFRRLAGTTTWTEIDEVAGPHVGDIEVVDETISGETAYEYAVSTADGAIGAATRVWAGPAAIPQYAYQAIVGGGYLVGFTTTDDTLETELHDTYDDAGGIGAFALRATAAAAETEVESGTLSNVPAPDLTFPAKLRHKLTSFTVDDYGEFGIDFNVTVPESE